MKKLIPILILYLGFFVVFFIGINVYPDKVITLATHPVTGFIGVLLCFGLATIGTAKALASIGKVVSGTAIFFPRIWTRSMVGSLFCEGNMVVSLVMTTILAKDLVTDGSKDVKNFCVFACGIIMGTCFYFSSIAAGVACTAVTIVDGKDKSLFSKNVVFEFFAGSLGIIGVAISAVIRQVFLSNREKSSDA